MFSDVMGLELDGSFGSSLPFFPNGDEHRNRNQYNLCPCKEPKNNPIWQQDQGVLGWLDGGKYRDSFGDECKYAGGNLMPDQSGNYTFNYTSDDSSPWHIWQDVIPHFWYGGPGSYTPNVTHSY
jgi:hypothetical protein